MFYLATLGQVKTLKVVTGTWVFLKANRSERPSLWGNYIDKEPTSLVYKAFTYPGNFIFLINFYFSIVAFLPQWLSGKESSCIVGDSGDVDLIPRLGRSPGGDLPTHYSCLKNLMDRGGWQATAQRVAESGMTEHVSRQEYLLYNVVLVSTVQQGESAICQYVETT